jgi:hypothetical protein
MRILYSLGILGGIPTRGAGPPLLGMALSLPRFRSGDLTTHHLSASAFSASAVATRRSACPCAVSCAVPALPIRLNAQSPGADPNSICWPAPGRQSLRHTRDILAPCRDVDHNAWANFSLWVKPPNSQAERRLKAKRYKLCNS